MTAPAGLPPAAQPAAWLSHLPAVWGGFPLPFWLAVGALVLSVLLGGLAELDRLDSGLARRRGDFGQETKRRPLLMGLLLFIIPGALAGAAAVALIMGKERWRKEAARIVLASALPGLLLFWVCSSCFPWPEWADSLWITGALALVFSLLQLWATVKLLRQWWGEPVYLVPWWPPLALWMQSALLAAALVAVILGPVRSA